MGKIRVLVVDDSAFMRYTINHYLSALPDIEVVGLAQDGLEALSLIDSLRPDVVTLDVEMPRMDGLTALRQIMKEKPLPVVMLSSLTKEGAAVTVEALTIGAVDFVTKPSQSTSIHQVMGELAQKIQQAARAKVKVMPAAVWARRTRASASAARPSKLVVIGSSTGGPGALHQVIPRLPADLEAGVIVVQHMPPNFTRSLAERLDMESTLPVKEAEAGDRLLTGQVFIAPGGFHLTLSQDGGIQLNKGPAVNGVRPAVDVTLLSAAALYGAATLAVILTGMGHDGRDGARAVKKAGGKVIAQDEATCVVYGMPRSVVEAGLADRILPIEEIADGICDLLQTIGQRFAAVRVRP